MPVTDPSSETIAAWGRLHAEPRHQLRYPSEHVVRFLSAIDKPADKSLLDIGCGSGRHLRAAALMGFFAYGCDVSENAVDLCAGICPRVIRCGMTALPYPGNHFDVALAYAVFYYGTAEDGQQAVRELHRILRPGGHAFITMRTSQDWRRNGIPASEPEHGMTMHFPTALELRQTYAAFSEFNLELEQVSTHSLSRVNSNWLITVTK